MMSKNSGIKVEQFYGNKNEPNYKQNRNNNKDENEIKLKRKQLNGMKRNDDLCQTPLTITSRTCPNTTDKFYRSQSSFPKNSLISEQECYQMNSGFNTKNKFNAYKNHKRIQKSMRGNGNHSNSRYNAKPLNISWESPKNMRQFSNGVKVNMKSTQLSYESNEKSNEENDENVVKDNKHGIQTDIRSFGKRLSISPKYGSDFETPPKKVNKEQKVTPLLSSTANTNNFRLNDCQRPKSSKQLMKTFTDSRDYENQSPTDLKSNSFSKNEFVFNDEEMPTLIENNNLSVIYSTEHEILDPNKPIGLRNLGNTCYMNSIVQAIFSLKFFIEDLKNKYENIKNISEYSSHFSMTKSLLKLYFEFNGLRNRIEDCSVDGVEKHLSNLKECVGKKSSPFKTGTQQDAAEFFAHIIDEIWEEFESFKQFAQNHNPIARNFEFETGGSLTCMKCNNKTKLDNEKSHALYLSLPKDNSLQTAFLDFLKDETTAHECVSANCGEHQNVLNKYFTKLSKVLFLQLGRYTEDGSKRTEEVMVPLNIYLPLKHNNSEININTIAPSPLATPYRSKLQEVFISDKVSSVVRKMSFENLDNSQTSAVFNVSNISMNTTINCNQNNIELELNQSIDPQLQEVNGSDQTNKANITPIKQLNESEVLNHSISNENEENITKNEISLKTNVLSNDSNVRNNKENTCIVEECFENEKTEKYQLVSVICHHGNSLSGGHYSSFVYNIETSQWFQCDDNDISLTDFESVQKNSKTSGYCYFYVHK